jgi:TMEM175 potassium channel family protein
LSDGVFAVIITLLGPALKPQEWPNFASLPLAASECPPAYVIKVDRRLAHTKERAMREEKITADRLAAFSDAVFAVIVTIMVLELKAPDEPAFSALWPLWPTAISYAVSYLFIAIIWINHHYLMRFVGPPTLGLIWINFVHLFMVSLLPFATAWVARTRLASSPVVFYAGLFVSIDIAYNLFEREVLGRADATQVSERTRRLARRRSLGVLASFTTAMLVAFVAPRLSFGLICGALILHLRPEAAPATRP